MNIKSLFSVIAVTASLIGCAHPLVISPDLAKIERAPAAQPIKKNVGYYIPDELRELEVTTPGGGGDKVSYKPYRDLEVGLFKMLGNVFENVHKLKGTADTAAIKSNGIAYVITPKLLTNSSSPSAFTWPPTKFTVDLTCNIADASGNPVVSPTVQGEGKAEFEEFKSNFSLSAIRASEDALKKMQILLAQEAALKK